MSCLEKYYLQKYKGITKESLSKLESNQIRTVTEFLLKTPEVIMTITDMTHTDYEKLTHEIFSKCRPECSSMMGRLERVGQVLSTGIPKLDKVLGGGIRGGEILEVYGLPSTGKTQICLTVAALASQEGQEVSVLYLDLKNDFDPLRYQELCKGCSEAEKIARIKIYRESKVTDVINILENYESSLCVGNTLFGGNLRLVVIDSLPATFYPCETDCDDSARVYQESVFQHIKRIAARFGLAVIVTNHAVSQNFRRKRKKSAAGYERHENFKPALGIYWLDVPDFRVYLASGAQSNEFSATLCKSTRTAEGQSFAFIISDVGIG